MCRLKQILFLNIFGFPFLHIDVFLGSLYMTNTERKYRIINEKPDSHMLTNKIRIRALIAFRFVKSVENFVSLFSFQTVLRNV